MEQPQHFSHEHLLSLVQLQPLQKNENSDTEDEDEDEDEDIDDFVVEECHVGKCKMCKEEIYPFQLCYYSCNDCDYSLHKFCAQLPLTQQNHPLHPDHNLTLSDGYQFQDPGFNFGRIFDSFVQCHTCQIERKRFYNYHCSICNFNMDIICATIAEQKMDHPSHPRQLQRYLGQMVFSCNACGEKHSGTFYHCTTCYWFKIHLDFALLPAKLLIQRSTNKSFTHTHLLTLAYSFPQFLKRARFYPGCKVCDSGFISTFWHYRCDKCRYYAHVKCATSMSEAFMSIFMLPGLGKTSKNFKDDDHPNLIRCPFPNESFNLLKHLFINKGELTIEREIDGEIFSHPHPLILIETLDNGSVSLHDPVKRVELLCDGCVRPITDLPFYKCSQDDCGFVLHEWCTRLPSEIQDHHGHPNHTLVLWPRFGRSFGVFQCKICLLPSNGFTYGCMQCGYYVDINCAFIPDAITHEAHPNHLLKRIEASPETYCMACHRYTIKNRSVFHCPTCEFCVHTKCALLLPREIRHRHTACALLKLHCEQSIVPDDEHVFWFLNVKSGKTLEITDHPHPLTYEQGLSADGECDVCHKQLQHYVIYKCFQCKLTRHDVCWCA
ncbi:uncharacterized protein LOC143636173 [Bidens hawaiensis]|uniref:uncharacterized protein LOC143636173 n=1 Tax=Bidens hawaiensis TaxID=980011 RepID=UPI0040491CD1